MSSQVSTTSGSTTPASVSVSVSVSATDIKRIIVSDPSNTSQDLNEQLLKSTDKLPQDEVEHLPSSIIFFYSLGHIFNDLCACCWFSYLLILLDKILLLSPSQTASVLLAGQIADGIATPLVGLGSDRSTGFTFCGYRIGRRHSWYLAGTLLVLANFFFVFGICLPCASVSPTPDSSILTIYYCVAAALFNVGWACVQVSHMSLVPSLSSIESERILLNSKRYAFTVMSNLFVFFILTVLIYFINMHDKKEQFHVLAYVCMGVGLFTSFTFFAGTLAITNQKEQKEDEEAALFQDDADVPSHEGGDDDDDDEARKSTHHLSSIVADDKDNATRAKSKYPTSGSVNDQSETRDIFVSSSFSAHQVRSEDHSAHSTDSSSNSDASTPTLDDNVQTVSSDVSSSSSPVAGTAPFVWTEWFKVPCFYGVGFIYMMSRLIVNVSQVFLPFYVLDALHFPLVFITAVPATCYLASFVAANYMKRINKRFGRRRTYICGALLSIVASVAFFFLPKDPLWLKYMIFLPALLLGFGNGTVMVCSVQLEADLIRDHLSSSAFVYGFFSLLDKISNGLVIFFLQSGNKRASDDDGDTIDVGDSSIEMYARLAVSVAPTIAAVLGILAVSFGLSDKLFHYVETSDNEGDTIKPSDSGIKQPQHDMLTEDSHSYEPPTCKESVYPVLHDGHEHQHSSTIQSSSPNRSHPSSIRSHSNHHSQPSALHSTMAEDDSDAHFSSSLVKRHEDLLIVIPHDASSSHSTSHHSHSNSHSNHDSHPLPTS